ncbi:phage replisome organizer N-terminal domain-containing protein [Facklamia sp. P9177]|uniref:phage replisome organizer N-terminal domain-containing protein n=1 Tax=Facklamia sp. P9177 TaxID=3421945 RepID=UPI003D17C130
MSENKRYYWLKLNENFFKEDTIQWIEDQENGKDYVIFYLKLCLESLKDNGKLVRYVGEKLIPYDVKALAKLTGTSLDTVAVAMKTFEQIGLVEMLETGELYLKQINEMIGSETDSAKRMRKLRAKENLTELPEPSHCDNNVQKSDIVVQKSDTEKEIEKEIDIDIKKKSNNSQQSKSRYAEDSNYFLLSKFLLSLIKKRNPEHKEPNLQNWADDFRKLVELDKRDLSQVKNVVIWCQNNDFWQNTILSPAKVRKHYDKLVLQMNSPNKTRNQHIKTEPVPSFMTNKQEVKSEVVSKEEQDEMKKKLSNLLK